MGRFCPCPSFGIDDEFMEMEQARSKTSQANEQLTVALLDLLESQFPVDEGQILQLRSASDFAGALHVHVNHLNRAVKEITQRTTTENIKDQLGEESKQKHMKKFELTKLWEKVNQLQPVEESPSGKKAMIKGFYTP